MSLTEAEPWLDHLGSCSPCFQEFKEFRRQSAIQRRRVLTWVATAAVLLFAVGGWLWVRARHSVETTDTAVLDLRERSVARGQSQSETGQAPLEISRTLSTWFLIFRLGAKKDPTMSVCSLTRVTSFCARRGWRSCMITLLICGSMLTSVAFGREHILLGFDSLVLSGPDIPSGCFDPILCRIAKLGLRFRLVDAITQTRLRSH